MKIPNIFRDRRVEKLVAELQQTVLASQIQLAAFTSVSSDNDANPYKDYDTAIKALGDKYDGIADWGCAQARSIVDVRAAFTIGNGIQVIKKNPTTGKKVEGDSKEFQKELDFINSFIERNNLDEEAVQEFAKEAEIEGRILLKLIPAEDKKNIDIRFISYSTYKYLVKTDPEDYMKYASADYRFLGEGKDISLTPGSFVYKKFAGRVDRVNKIMPKTATVLKLLENLDKALSDLRKINNLFAGPTPHFNCQDSAAAKDLHERLKAINWKIGKMIVTTGATFNMVGIDANGAESLIKEITNIVKVVSGIVGVPVHFLGMPDLMSNRSTSTDMFEMIIASTNRERKTWVGTYEELFKKALQMANKDLGTSFNVDCISCDIPQITAAKLKELCDIWLPLYQANVVDLDYMLSMIPDADPNRIKAAQKEEAQRQLDMLKSQEAAAGSQQGGSGNGE